MLTRTWGNSPRSDWATPRGSERFYSCEMFMIESRSEKKKDGLRSPLTASLEPLFVRPELRLGRLLVAARAADGQRREDGALEELAAGRLAFDGVLEPGAAAAEEAHVVALRVGLAPKLVKVALVLVVRAAHARQQLKGRVMCRRRGGSRRGRRGQRRRRWRRGGWRRRRRRRWRQHRRQRQRRGRPCARSGIGKRMESS
mmetsp:Transcript_40131/g.129435  ORF Transcript_40131/g.129435 Transcript_40131/m.129435 type:complete len:200 (+) Transcript_40131:1-600(+)